MKTKLSCLASTLVVLALALTLLGCSGDGSAGGSTSGGPPDASASSGLLLTSSAFQDSGTLPAKYTCDGAGVSPPLEWTGVPEGTAELALLMTTIAPDGLKWNWVLYHVPSSTAQLAEASAGIGVAGLTSDGPNLAYSPPCSQGPGPKTYTFTLHALSSVPTFSGPANQISGQIVTDAIRGITLASTSISVSYTRP